MSVPLTSDVPSSRANRSPMESIRKAVIGSAAMKLLLEMMMTSVICVTF